ncbi:MAG: hypothetical protein AAF387_10255 [Pseudomonadota bacterium]
MKSTKIPIIACVLVLGAVLCPSAWAADAAGNYAIWGVGRSSCFQFSKAIAKDETEKYRSYLMGYLTAFNTLSEETYSVSGKSKLNDISEWIENYCDSHQIESFNRAIQQYVSEQYDKRLTVSPGSTQGWGAKSTK